MSAKPPEPKPELSAVEKAWLAFEAQGHDHLSPRILFYEGWLARGFHQLDLLNRTDALKTD